MRRRIIAALTVFAAAAGAAFAFSKQIAAFLTVPVDRLGIKLYAFGPAEKFAAYLHLAFWTGALAAAPFCLVQAGLFVWPALRKKERLWTLVSLIIVPVFFFSGAALAYRFLAPAVLRFFLNFGTGDGIAPLWSFKEYLSILYTLMLAAGILLQTPLFLFAAFAAGIVTPAAAARARPAIILGIFLAAALCTPPDVISQIALAVPLYLLFELSLFAGRLVRRR